MVLHSVRFRGFHELVMHINRKYRIEEKNQKLTLNAIKREGFDQALDIAYGKILYLVANSPESTLATESLAWSHNLLADSRSVKSAEVANDLRLLATFYRRLAHMIYWDLKKSGQLSDIADFIRAVE